MRTTYNTTEEFDYFLDQMLDRAVKDFQTTEEFRLLQKKREQMDRDCGLMFLPEEKAFALECFELIMDLDGREESYVYRKGWKDCVSLLKWMGVLA